MKGAALVRLAFVTLGRYDFAYNPKYLEPVKMLGYLDDENESIRRAAALAFCRVQHRNAKLQKLVRSKRDRGGSHYPLVAKVLSCLHSCGRVTTAVDLLCTISPPWTQQSRFNITADVKKSTGYLWDR